MHFNTINSKQLRILLVIAIFSLMNSLLVYAEEFNVHDSFKITPDLDSPNGQRNAHVASDGVDTYLVVWEEGTNTWENSAKQIYAARVQVKDGLATSLDPDGIHLLNTNNIQERPKVEFGDGVFLVTWQELSDSTDYDVLGMRIDSSGNKLDPNGIIISSEPLNQITPDMAYDNVNDRFFIVWADFRDNTGYDIYGARVDSSGDLIDPNGILLHDHVDEDYGLLTPVVATNGENFLISWSEKYNQWYGHRMGIKMFTSDGVLLKEVSPNIKNSYTSEEGKHYGISTAYQRGIISGDQNFLILYQPVNWYRSYARTLLQALYVKADGTMPYDGQLNIEKKLLAPHSTGVFIDPHYFIIWEGAASVPSDSVVNFLGDMDYNIYAGRVDNTVQTALDYNNSIVISDSLGAEMRPAAAKGSASEMLIVYEEDNMMDYPDTEWVLKARLVTITQDADTDGDGCISFSEIASYISGWLSGNGITLTQVFEAIVVWKEGVGCN